MEGRGKSRRRNPYWSWKRRGSGLLAVLLTLSLVFGDISGLSRVVLAGQGTVREEFRIHQEEILKAAEEAIQKGEPLSEPLAVTSEKEKTEEKSEEKLLACYRQLSDEKKKKLQTYVEMLREYEG